MLDYFLDHSTFTHSTSQVTQAKTNLFRYDTEKEDLNVLVVASNHRPRHGMIAGPHF